MLSRKKRSWYRRKKNTFNPSKIFVAMAVAFVLICFAIFFIIHEDASFEIPQSESHPTIEFFTTPRFNYMMDSSKNRLEEEIAITKLAIRSWLALSPKISVVLFGDGSSLLDFSNPFGPRVSVESTQDFTFRGTPLFNSLIARAQASKSDICILIDPDIILFPEFISALQSTLQLRRDWLLVSIPKTLDLKDNAQRIDLSELQKIIALRSDSENCKDRAIIAWNKGKLSLQPLVFPSFITGKGFHNQWLIHETLSSDLRLVIDASTSFSSFYPRTIDHSQWETSINSKLAASYGSFHVRPSKSFNILKLLQCSGQHLFYYAANNTVYTDKIQEQDHSLVKCLDSLSHRKSCSVDTMLKVETVEDNEVGLPFSLESLLRIVADENKTVVLGIAGNNYRDILMSWICRLRHLSVRNFIVGAIDSDIYDFAVLQGLPVFKDPLAPAEIGLEGCHFGTKCFQRVTKVKSRLVLHILKMGYNVLLSDVDVYWFKNPLPFLQAFDPPVLLAQSDEFNKTGPINMPHRLNSGFYYARADYPTISAITRVVKHASASNLSEQPSFYKILCGEDGINRINGSHCVDPQTQLTTIALDRKLFPNGAFLGLWQRHDVLGVCKKLGCFVIHNNWLTGWEKKIKRQRGPKLQLDERTVGSPNPTQRVTRSADPRKDVHRGQKDSVMGT